MVKEAEDGQRGLEILAEERDIDIIFSDYRMPNMNGYDFSKAVKTNPKYINHSRVPIVGVGDFPDDEQEFLVKCMVKSFTSNDLIRCIQEYCR